jgi:hypothetical protein
MAKPATPLRFMSDYLAKTSVRKKEKPPEVGWPPDGSVPDYVARVTSVAKTQAEAHRENYEKKVKNEPVWDAKQWLAAEGCSDMLEEVLLGPLKKVMEIGDNVGTVELELIRAIANEKEPRAVVMSLLEKSMAMQRITDFILVKMDKLMKAAAESGQALNSKFVEEYNSNEMAFGGQESFFKGLDGLIGPPNPNLLEGMRNEHSQCKDSHIEFETPNYGVITTSHVEYLVVVEPDSLFPKQQPQYKDLKLPSDIQKQIDDGKAKWLEEFVTRRTSDDGKPSPVRQRSSSPVAVPEAKEKDRVGVRKPKQPSVFMPKISAIVEQLEDRDLAKLQLEEFHAARLYTGHALNLDLQRNARSAPALLTSERLAQTDVRQVQRCPSWIAKPGRVSLQAVEGAVPGQLIRDNAALHQQCDRQAGPPRQAADRLPRHLGPRASRAVLARRRPRRRGVRLHVDHDEP